MCIRDRIDPFGYRRSGNSGYPKRLVAQLEDEAVNLTCYIWPANSDSPRFKLPGSGTSFFQGFFFYRHDRLLTVGGWHGVFEDHRSRRLARIAVDIDGQEHLLTMNSEKSNVQVTQDLARSIETAKAVDGTTFSQYLETAEATLKNCLLYTSPSPRDRTRSRMPSSA